MFVNEFVIGVMGRLLVGCCGGLDSNCGYVGILFYD